MSSALHGHHLVMSSYFPGPCSLLEHQSPCDAKCPKIASPECRSFALATIFAYRMQQALRSFVFVTACRRVGSITGQVAAACACCRTGLGDLFASRPRQQHSLTIACACPKPTQIKCSAPIHKHPSPHRQERTTDVQSLSSFNTCPSVSTAGSLCRYADIVNVANTRVHSISFQQRCTQ